MACVNLPLPVAPTLPFGLTAGASLDVSVPGGTLDFCCKILAIPPVAVPIPLPPLILNVGVITALNVAISALNAYHDALTFDCPFE